MNGEVESRLCSSNASPAITGRSYVCKSGVGDVLIGAAGAIADYNGADKASHIKTNSWK